jgi:hypothetical protein
VKFWISELQKEEGVSNSKACFIANFRSWGARTHTHTRFDGVQDQHQVMQPHIHLFSLYMGFEVSIWVCTPVCFWACSHVMNILCNNFGRRRKEKKNRKKNYFFFFTHHHRRAHGRGSLSNVVINAVIVRSVPFRLTSFAVLSNICHHSFRRLSVAIHLRQCTIFFKSYVLCTYVSNTIFFKPYVVLKFCN